MFTDDWLGLTNDKATAMYIDIGLLLLAFALLFLLLCWESFEGLSATNADYTDLDCDIRIGCNGRDLTQRSVTNILLDRSQQIEADRDRAAYQAMMNKGNKEGFDLSLYQPGVDRPYIAALQVDRKLRSEDLIEGLTGRAHSDYVFQQFGNDGTVINPAVNPLYRPARHITGVPPV